jgi:hypothetical protein
MNHLPLRECGYALTFIVVLLGLYLGAYFAMVERVDFGELIASSRPYLGPARPFAFYRFGGDWSQSFFYPAHALDRRIRAELWEGERDPDERPPLFGFGKK